jgi:hypothetical protein
MVDPPGVVRRKPILVQMYTHDFLVLHSPVTTLAAGTQSHFRVFSGLAKCTLQETLGLVHPFNASITLTCPARVHPLTVLHPLAYITSPQVTINYIYAVSLLSNR